MIKEGVLFDLDSLNQVKEAVSGLDELMKKIVEGFTSILSLTLYSGQKLQGALNNLNEDCIQRGSDKFSKLKHFLDNATGKATAIMNMSDTNDTELIRFSGNGPLFSLSKTIINSIPYSYIYEQSEEELRTSDGNIFLDYRGNDASVYYLIDYLNDKVIDYSQIKFREQLKLLELFEFCNLPIPIELLDCREKRDKKQKKYEKGDEVSLNINGKKNDMIKNYLINNNLWDDYIMKYKNGYVDYNYLNDIMSINMSYKYMKYINGCMESGYLYIKKEEIKNIDTNLLEEEVYSIFGDQQKEAVKTYLNGIPTVFADSTIIEEKYFETQLVNWIGKEKKWKLIFRASEHDFKASEFHKYCDTKCPTVTIIKHIGHDNKINIFGGYTTQYWKSITEKDFKYDDESFLFTLSNEHNIPPTKYPLLKHDYALYCDKTSGPDFMDIHISDDCHKNYHSCINEHFNKYSQSLTPQCTSLFVNTDEPTKLNCFTVDDYEVYEIISNSDLYLPNSILITKEMGIELSRWFDKNKEWELLYRCSDENRSVRKWHEKCDEKESLVIIQGKGKDNKSYIFGGYTSVGWGKNHIDDTDEDSEGMGWRIDPKAFLFSLTNPYGHDYTKLDINLENSVYALASNNPLFELEFYCGLYLRTDIDDDQFINGNNDLLDDEEDPIYISPYPELGNSFFVNTDKPDEENIFDLIDFEVYTSV
ncbi:hypothetical protein WA158_004005 [Blastocystis sp. Blastoise]